MFQLGHKIVGTSSLFFLTFVVNASAPNPVQWGDIKGWKELGSRTAAALSSSGQVIAIYDFSFPEMDKAIFLGSVGAQKVDLSVVIDQIQKNNQKDEAESEVDSVDVDAAVSALSAAQKNHQAQGAFPKKWWKKLPWRVGLKSEATHAPGKFNLAEIDFALVARDPKRFEEKIIEAKNALWSAEDQSLISKIMSENFLQQFEFIRQKGGAYSLFWHPAHEATDQGEKQISLPKKMVDLVDINEGMRRALAWDLFKTALDEAMNQLTVPIAGALLGTAANRFFHYYNLLVKSHQDMIFEFLSLAEEGAASFSPYSALTQQDRLLAGQSLLLAQSTLKTAWQWHFKDPAQEWLKVMKTDQERADEAMRWLVEHKALPVRLNERFGMATTPDLDGDIFLLSLWSDKKSHIPLMAVSHQEPLKIKNLRSRFEATTVAIEFGSHFIPIAGGVIRWVYESLLEEPINQAKRWEARLGGFFEERMQEGGENWENDLDLLDAQRINPFELSHQKAWELVKARWSAVHSSLY